MVKTLISNCLYLRLQNYVKFLHLMLFMEIMEVVTFRQEMIVNFHVAERDSSHKIEATQHNGGFSDIF